MELFEILFILLFILIPVFEGIRKSRQRQAEPREERGSEPVESDWELGPDREPDREPAGQAADMLPDDLWEILTGERRERSPAPVGTADPDEHDLDDLDDLGEPDSWWSEADEATTVEPEPEPVFTPPTPARVEPAPEPEARPSRVVARATEPVAPARSARTPAPALQLEPGRVRRAPAGASSTSFLQALRSADGVRQAVVLAEVLGPPRSMASDRRI